MSRSQPIPAHWSTSSRSSLATRICQPRRPGREPAGSPAGYVSVSVSAGWSSCAFSPDGAYPGRRRGCTSGRPYPDSLATRLAGLGGRCRRASGWGKARIVPVGVWRSRQPWPPATGIARRRRSRATVHVQAARSSTTPGCRRSELPFRSDGQTVGYGRLRTGSQFFGAPDRRAGVAALRRVLEGHVRRSGWGLAGRSRCSASPRHHPGPRWRVRPSDATSRSRTTLHTPGSAAYPEDREGDLDGALELSMLIVEVFPASRACS